MADNDLLALINKVRRFVNDAGVEQSFTDEDIESALCTHEDRVSLLPLAPIESVENGNVVRKTWEAPIGDWSNGATLYDDARSAVTPSKVSPEFGRWEFGLSIAGRLYVSGRTFDVYLACADLIDLKLARMSDLPDFSADGLSINRGSSRDALIATAARYRTRSRGDWRMNCGMSSGGKLVRTDTNL